VAPQGKRHPAAQRPALSFGCLVRRFNECDVHQNSSKRKQPNWQTQHYTIKRSHTPKRRKLNVPLTLENMLSPFQDVEDEVLVDLEQIENSNHDNDESLPQLQEFGDENCCEEDDVVIFRRVIPNLQ